MTFISSTCSELIKSWNHGYLNNQNSYINFNCTIAFYAKSEISKGKIWCRSFKCLHSAFFLFLLCIPKWGMRLLPAKLCTLQCQQQLSGGRQGISNTMPSAKNLPHFHSTRIVSNYLILCMGPHIWPWMLETIFKFWLLDFWTIKDRKLKKCRYSLEIYRLS